MDFLAALAAAAEMLDHRPIISQSSTTTPSFQLNGLPEHVSSPSASSKRTYRNHPRTRRFSNTVADVSKRKRPSFDSTSTSPTLQFTVRLKLDPVVEESKPVSIFRTSRSYLKLKDIPIFPARTAPCKHVAFSEDVLVVDCPMDEDARKWRLSYNKIPEYVRNRWATIMAQIEEEEALDGEL